jgi:hypothetical protein
MEPAAEPRPSQRFTRLRDDRRRQRRWLAAAVALVGTISLAAGLARGPLATSTVEQQDRPGSATNLNDVVESGQENTPSSDGPGGVGPDPARTGLPAVPAPGGNVRTGTRDQGCFGTIREYQEQWHRTGIEPDPCFTTQPASDQRQPAGVKRSYNGHRF